jgi:hypothetical protein
MEVDAKGRRFRSLRVNIVESISQSTEEFHRIFGGIRSVAGHRVSGIYRSP